MEYIIETKDLSFAFKHQQILDHINLKIPQGGIYGYLGKNGAGKTTTIKLLLGLLDPIHGSSIYYSDKEFRKHREDCLSQIGSLIESPAFYDNLSGLENFKYLDLIYRCGEARVKEVLSKVGLWDARNKKVKKYSTGMKQRLGIGMAIFHNPEILILDEPLNGLDPEAVHSIRELLLELKAEGKTILLSSHILNEIEKVCTHVGIIEKGHLLYQGSLSELMQNIHQEIVFVTSEVEKALRLCEDYQFIATVLSAQELQVGIENKEKHNELLRLFVQHDIPIYGVSAGMNNLETIFLNLTSHVQL
ncbi:ABC transporter ATP-binding protein [Bacteroides coprosuis]|uniref:ABC transporter ATP-binding protein n=1 Tax=Bacteroides coprosuis TaxID=151276 RepID=UPI001DF02890|nr:ATP-binding cassette domain-containing protein [Bacteroides coprosuis]HJD92282.1 ATP-binding cassette domain-containing protein [Bacteroides coprosuis]